MALYTTAQTPYAHYPLDGNANDISGNSLNGTTQGSPTNSANRYNQNGKAMNFDGAGDYVSLPVDFDFATLTVVLWFKAASTSGTTVMYSSDHSAIQNGQQKIVVENNQNFSQILMRSGNAAWLQNIDLNEWYQAAFVRTPTQVKFYVNGNLVNTVNNPTNAHANSGVNYATIGAGYTLANFFDGDVDDLLIYNTALNDAQLTANYSSVKEEKMLQEEINTFGKDGYINIAITDNAAASVSLMEVYDYTGKRIVQKNAIAGTQQLNDSPLSNGVYVVSFFNTKSELVATRKVLIN
ncbi:MAG: T9SS type A sorting domain-containing protein [Bacteroidetes bacterium]|nr:T9SS type A sorting domain-containing protein [Bacteroidota bacterium]